MDAFALRAANCLVGNPPDAAALEMTITGPTLRATSACVIAVGGADLELRVNGQPIPNWMSAYVRRGWTIEFSGRRSGCRAYLAVAGGISVPTVMGSRSTYLAGGFGGLAGRALKAGDLLPLAPVVGRDHLPARAARQLPEHLLPAYSDRPTVTALVGPQDEAFSQEGLEAFFSGEYQVSPTADRMGYRLQGPGITHRSQPGTTPGDIISDGIVLGAVQVPADGQPIVMMADRQTTGGYAKIAVVASADVPLLAQCLPGKSSVRFQRTPVEEAQRRYRRMVEELERLG
jgi:antagonist of KipI